MENTNPYLIKRFFRYSILFFLINMIVTFLVFLVSIYVNPKTYHGTEGHNNGLVLLLFSLLFWGMLVFANRKKPKELIHGLMMNLSLDVIFFTLIAVLEWVN